MITTQKLTDLTHAVDELANATRTARDERDSAIVQATREGLQQRDIVTATGLTREQVRRIVRAAEAEPRPNPTE